LRVNQTAKKKPEADQDKDESDTQDKGAQQARLGETG